MANTKISYVAKRPYIVSKQVVKKPGGNFTIEYGVKNARIDGSIQGSVQNNKSSRNCSSRNSNNNCSSRTKVTNSKKSNNTCFVKASTIVSGKSSKRPSMFS